MANYTLFLIKSLIKKLTCISLFFFGHKLMEGFKGGQCLGLKFRQIGFAHLLYDAIYISHLLYKVIYTQRKLKLDDVIYSPIPCMMSYTTHIHWTMSYTRQFAVQCHPLIPFTVQSLIQWMSYTTPIHYIMSCTTSIHCAMSYTTQFHGTMSNTTSSCCTMSYKLSVYCTFC